MNKKISCIVLTCLLLICAAIIAAASGVFSNIGSDNEPVYTVNPITGEIPTSQPDSDAQPYIGDIQLEELKENGYDICILFNTYTDDFIAMGSANHYVTFIALNEYEYEIASPSFRKGERNGTKVYPEFLAIDSDAFTDNVVVDVLLDGKKFSEITLSFETRTTESGYERIELVSCTSADLAIKTVHYDMRCDTTW